MSTNLQASVTLAYPIAVTKGGKPETIDSLTVRRPRARHVKSLVALMGPAFTQLLLSGSDAGSLTVSGNKLNLGQGDAERLAGLLTLDNLDALTGIVADMAGISAQEADDLDPGGLFAILKAIAGFFPALAAGIASLSSRPT